MRKSMKRAVLSLRINFFVMGVLLGGWSTRIPEIKNALKMSDGTLGRALIGAAVGSLISSRIIGKLIRELGTKRVFFMGTIIFPIGYLSIAFAPNVYCVFIGITFFCMGYLFLDNPLTIITQDLESKSERKYLSGFHAFWSMGTLCAAFFGSFLIGHVKYSYHLTGIAVLSYFILTLSARNLENHEATREKVEHQPLPWRGTTAWIVLAIGFGMMFSNSAEFGATDWSALFLRDVLSITGRLYVGAYIAFETGMIISRILGDKYIHKYGPMRVVRFCGFVGACLWLGSMLLGLSLDHLSKPLAYVVILLGYLFAGLGVGPLFPGFITILGNIPGIEMGVALSRALFIAIAGFAIVPALIGVISDATSLKFGMLLPMALLAGAGYLSRVGKNSVSGAEGI